MEGGSIARSPRSLRHLPSLASSHPLVHEQVQTRVLITGRSTGSDGSLPNAGAQELSGSLHHAKREWQNAAGAGTARLAKRESLGLQVVEWK